MVKRFEVEEEQQQRKKITTATCIIIVMKHVVLFHNQMKSWITSKCTKTRRNDDSEKEDAHVLFFIRDGCDGSRSSMWTDFLCNQYSSSGVAAIEAMRISKIQHHK